MTTNTPVVELNRLFGLYKAEWLNGQLFSLFTAPSYMPHLRSHKPFALIGGRGTGKTTVLRGLSYEGQFAFADKSVQAIPTWHNYGIYYRVNTNRVTAFQGPELDEERWTKFFAHYVNLTLCSKLVIFLEWYRQTTGRQPQLSNGSFERISDSLHLPNVTTFDDLLDGIGNALVRFEASINSIADDDKLALSLQGHAVDVFATEIAATDEFKGKTFSFLIDEYENFLDYQQRVVNTLIKHCGGPYTIQIGVKELGWRTKDTLNSNERLHHPADYQRLDIGEELADSFPEFAKRVCDSRLQIAGVGQQVEAFFPRLSEEEEAIALGVQDAIGSVGALLRGATASELKFAMTRPMLELYSMSLWATAQGTSVLEVFREAREDYPKWQERYSNYRHAFLFTIRRRKRGIRKYYAGWETLCRLSGGNIRYLLELVHQSFSDHFESELGLGSPVSPEIQTRAAERVGKKNLAELEGVSVDGARLTKLLLALGRVFQVMASDPIGHAPEVNQFALEPSKDGANSASDQEALQVEKLLRTAVMHLALIRQPGNKLADEADTKDYDYSLHPIFAPFFVFSYRRKRKTKLTPSQVLALVNKPQETIRSILSSSNRLDVADTPLPDQLMLFQGFFDASS